MDFQSSQDEVSEDIRKHYKVERELANRLRKASREERVGLYSIVYDELFRRVPYHSQLMRKRDQRLRVKEVIEQMNLVGRFLKSGSTFLEIGSGDCALALEVAKHVDRVYAIDVSKEITKGTKLPKNFELLVTDGFNIPVPENSVDVAYSRDLVEHLHPDDFREQIAIIAQKLTSNGLYICITPNRLSGPHDISRYFDPIATGFHLKEYTIMELSEILTQSGFDEIRTYIGGKGFYSRFPLVVSKVIEKTLYILPFSIRKQISNMLPIMALLGITLVAKKH